jgi:hypothetical protein
LCYSGPGARRRRRKAIQDRDGKLELNQRNRDRHRSLLRRRDHAKNYEPQRNSSTIVTNHSSMPNSVRVTRSSKPEKAIISDQENVTNKQLHKKTVDPSRSKSHVSVQRVNRPDESLQSLTSARTLRPSIASIHLSDLLTVPSSTPIAAMANHSAISRLSHLNKASITPQQPTSVIKIQSQPKETKSMHLKDKRKTTTTRRSTSNISVSRLKRTLSTGRITYTDHHTTNIPMNDHVPESRK